MPHAVSLFINATEYKSTAQQFFRICCGERKNKQKHNAVLLIGFYGINGDFTVFKIVDQKSFDSKKESKSQPDVCTFEKILKRQPQRLKWPLFVIGHIPGHRHHKNQGLKDKLIRPFRKSYIVSVERPNEQHKSPHLVDIPCGFDDSSFFLHPSSTIPAREHRCKRLLLDK